MMHARVCVFMLVCHNLLCKSLAVNLFERASVRINTKHRPSSEPTSNWLHFFMVYMCVCVCVTVYLIVCNPIMRVRPMKDEFVASKKTFSYFSQLRFWFLV